MFSSVNIAKELEKARKDEVAMEDNLLKEANKLLLHNKQEDENLLVRIKQKQAAGNTFSIKILKKENIFSLDLIKKTAIKYRLRFLDSTLFKKEIPYEALLKVKEFEKEYNVKVDSFKILAPSEAFDLKDRNIDPLLFAKVADDKYYLLHQWGKDLAWYRGLLYLPVKNIYSFFYSVAVLAVLISFSIPSLWMRSLIPGTEINIRIWLSAHCTIGLLGFFIFLGSVLNKNFSEAEWDSKYFN